MGRKKILTPPPTKEYALENGIEVRQPKSLKSFDFSGKKSQLAVVAQYGKILPKSTLEAFERGLVNVHTSLLPKYRGASPIQTALKNGEKETGVTFMLMDEGMDTGDILKQFSLEINPNETYLELDARLSELSISNIEQTLEEYLEGNITPQKQDDEQASKCFLLSRDDGKVDFSQSAEEIYNQYRGLTPWPGIWTTLDVKRLKLLEIKPSDKDIEEGKLLFENKSLFVGTSSKSIEILKLGLEGKAPMDSATFFNGYKQYDGSYLGRD